MRWLTDREAVLQPISGAMGEGMGGGGNGMGNPEPPGPPPSPPPSPPPPPPSPSGAIIGAFWVEGSAIHWIAQDGTERSYTGPSVGTPPGATVGAVWNESPSDVHSLRYIDASGVARQVVAVDGGGSPSAPGGANIGAIWVQGTELRWVTPGLQIARRTG
jgi:hypothetical protein